MNNWLLTHGAVASLIMARVSALAWAAPGWGTAGLGWRVRLALAILLTGLLVPLVGPEIVVPAGPVALAKACVGEIVVGASLGLTMALVVAGARQAGELVGAQAGLSAAGLYDPEAGEELTPLGHLYGLVALAAFLAIDGPLHLVGSVADSFRAVPAGGWALTEETLRLAFGRVGWALALALQAAAPVALALVVASLALGLLGRSTSALGLTNLALPVRSALGLLFVLLGLVTLAATLTSAWMSLLDIPRY